MKKLKYFVIIFMMIVSFTSFKEGVRADTLPNSFHLSSSNMHRKAGINIGYKIAYINGKKTEVYCLELARDTPPTSCTFRKTSTYIDDPGFLYIVNYPAVSGDANYMYNVRETVLYKYIYEKRYSKIFNSGKTTSISVLNSLNESKASVKGWNRYNRATNGLDQKILNGAKNAKSQETNYSMKVSVNKNDKTKCANGYVISQPVTVEGTNMNLSSMSISVSGVSNYQIVDKTCSGNKCTFSIKVPSTQLTSKKQVNVTVKANTNYASSKYYVYESGCSHVQKLLLKKEEPKVETTSASFNMDSSACGIDYTVDAACVGCDDESEDAGRSSYIIQDTTNWEGIFKSSNKDNICSSATSSQVNNVVNYYQYKKNSGIFCREEVRFVFPNSKNELTVNRGRYFTVHSPFRDENKLVIKPYGATYNADVEILNDSKYDSNWGSIKVIKTRECRMANRSDEQSVLNSNKQNLKFKSDPVIKLTYKGNDDNGKYDIDTELAVEPEDEFGSGTKEEITVSKSTYTSKSGTYKSNYIYKDVQTRTYKLPDKTYRYILKEGAVFVSGNQTEGTYIDLGISTIPVSTKSKVNSDTKPLISLKFTLDDDMKLSKSFKKDNNYLPSCTLKTDPNNIYNYVKAKGKVSANAVTGITDSEKKQEIANSSCAKLYQCSATSDGIGNCKRAGVGTCITNRTINKIGNNDSNNCYVKSTASVSDENNYVCSINVASGVPGIYVPECPGCAKETTSDTTSDTTTDSSTGPSTSSVTTPLCQKEITDGVCLPSTGYSTLEYRTIDLDNPFPGQSGSGRYTGLNWCGYNEETETWNCNGNSNNEVVQEYILKNRGVSGSSVYNLEPMYSVTLTKDEISKIQGYNSSNDYDDFRLTCNNKGEECVSSFVSQYATKNCQNFGSCSQ